MTTRRWLVAVAVAAVITFVGIETEKWKRRRQSVEALRKYRACEAFYENGTITFDRLIFRSQILLDSKLAVCKTRQQVVTAIAEHRIRVQTTCDRELRRPEFGCFGRMANHAEAAEAKDAVVAECETRLNRLDRVR